jgi:hypothetical protein
MDINKEVKDSSKSVDIPVKPIEKIEVRPEHKPDLKTDILLGSKPQYKIDWEDNKKIELIEVKIRKVNQLFNSFDPSPFLEKDLDDDAFEYIVSAVGEHHLRVKQKIVIYMPKYEKKKISETDITRAIHHFFEYKKTLADRSIKLKFQEGQISLVIGLIFLGTCLVLRELIIANTHNFAMSIVAEGLIIGGWVAMWKPISNILYDWWPIRKEKNIYNKISKMEIEYRFT